MKTASFIDFKLRDTSESPELTDLSARLINAFRRSTVLTSGFICSGKTDKTNGRNGRETTAVYVSRARLALEDSLSIGMADPVNTFWIWFVNDKQMDIQSWKLWAILNVTESTCDKLWVELQSKSCGALESWDKRRRMTAFAQASFSETVQRYIDVEEDISKEVEMDRWQNIYRKLNGSTWLYVYTCETLQVKKEK